MRRDERKKRELKNEYIYEEIERLKEQLRKEILYDIEKKFNNEILPKIKEEIKKEVIYSLKIENSRSNQIKEKLKAKTVVKNNKKKTESKKENYIHNKESSKQRKHSGTISDEEFIKDFLGMKDIENTSPQNFEENINDKTAIMSDDIDSNIYNSKNIDEDEYFFKENTMYGYNETIDKEKDKNFIKNNIKDLANESVLKAKKVANEIKNFVKNNDLL